MDIILNALRSENLNVSGGKIIVDDKAVITESDMIIRRGTGDDSIVATDLGAVATGDGAVSLGIHTISTNEAEISLGKYNVSDETTIFSIGNGVSDEDRMNAFEIKTDVVLEWTYPNNISLWYEFEEEAVMWTYYLKAYKIAGTENKYVVNAIYRDSYELGSEEGVSYIFNEDYEPIVEGSILYVSENDDALYTNSGAYVFSRNDEEPVNIHKEEVETIQTFANLGGKKILVEGDSVSGGGTSGDSNGVASEVKLTGATEDILYLVGATEQGRRSNIRKNVGLNTLGTSSDGNAINGVAYNYATGSIIIGNLLEESGTSYVNISPNRITADTLNISSNNFEVDGVYGCYAAAFYETSDERLKDFSNEIVVDFNKLKEIRKSYFTWKDGDDKTQIGTSAQDVQKVYPELVSENKDGILTVDYARLSLVALAAIDKLDARLSRIEKILNIIE